MRRTTLATTPSRQPSRQQVDGGAGLDPHDLRNPAGRRHSSTGDIARETGSRLLILEVCGSRFRQFSGSGEHIFRQISTKSHVQIKFSNADFVFNGE